MMKLTVTRTSLLMYMCVYCGWFNWKEFLASANGKSHIWWWLNGCRDIKLVIINVSFHISFLKKREWVCVCVRKIHLRNGPFQGDSTYISLLDIYFPLIIHNDFSWIMVCRLIASVAFNRFYPYTHWMISEMKKKKLKIKKICQPQTCPKITDLTWCCRCFSIKGEIDPATNQE